MSAEEIPTIQSLVNVAKERFLKEFGSEDSTEPFICACAPGRVNLIGEHTGKTTIQKLCALPSKYTKIRNL